MNGRWRTGVSIVTVLSIALYSVALAQRAVAQQPSIKTTGSIETAEQLVSTETTGTAPLLVSSTTMVANLNADLLDGNQSTDFAGATATAAEILNLQDQIDTVQGQLDALGLARVARTGQSALFGQGDDGDLQLGVGWSNPRFTDNGDGTVTDNLSGLLWLADASCADDLGVVTFDQGQLDWPDALLWVAALADSFCGLSDGSLAGEWRLPNVRELQSLVHYGVSAPVIPNTTGTGKSDLANDPAQCAFTGVELETYWSSTTVAGDTANAWSVGLADGAIAPADVKSTARYAWPVRGAIIPFE